MKTHLVSIAAVMACHIMHAQNQFSSNEFQMDIAKSELKWHGGSLFQINDHDGIVQFKKGYLKVQDGKLWGGSFEVDMNTIKTLDTGGANGELDKHLKNEDFFDVKKYPTAWLSIQKVKPIENDMYEVEANLNIKGITKPILFNAKLEEINNRWQMTTKFIIDRQRWNITYGSPDNDVMDPVRDYSISDAIKFEVKVLTD